MSERDVFYAIIIICNIFVVIINIANIRLMRKMAQNHKEQEARLRAMKTNSDIKTQGNGNSRVVPIERPIPFKGDIIR